MRVAFVLLVAMFNEASFPLGGRIGNSSHYTMAPVVVNSGLIVGMLWCSIDVYKNGTAFVVGQAEKVRMATFSPSSG